MLTAQNNAKHKLLIRIFFVAQVWHRSSPGGSTTDSRAKDGEL